MRFILFLALFIPLFSAYGQESGAGASTTKVGDKGKAVMDTVDHLASQAIDVTDSLPQIKNPLDTLSVIEKVEHTHRKVEEKTDALSTEGLSQEVKGRVKNNQKIDSARTRIKSKWTAVKDSLGVNGDELPTDRVNKELSEIDQDLNLEEAGVEDVTGDTGLDQLGADVKKDLEVEEVSELNDKVKEVGELPEEKLGELKEAGGIDKVSEQVDQVGEVSEDLSNYQEEVNQVREGNTEGVEQRIDEQAGQMSEIQHLQEQSGEFEELKELSSHQKGTEYSDPEFVKQRILQKSKNIVSADVLKPYQGKIDVAQTKLSAIKKADTLKGFRIRKAHKLRNKSFRDRIKLAFNLEINRTDYTSFDLAPFMAYRLYDRWTLYGGYMYRFNFDSEAGSFPFDKHTYGPRALIAYNFYKGFFVTGSFERIRTDVPENSNHSETIRQWVNGGYVGVGKAYDLAKRVKGNIRIMYNFLHHNEKSPYPKKFNIRLGFDIDFIKRKKRVLDIPK